METNQSQRWATFIGFVIAVVGVVLGVVPINVKGPLGASADCGSVLSNLGEDPQIDACDSAVETRTYLAAGGIGGGVLIAAIGRSYFASTKPAED